MTDVDWWCLRSEYGHLAGPERDIKALYDYRVGSSREDFEALVRDEFPSGTGRDLTFSPGGSGGEVDVYDGNVRIGVIRLSADGAEFTSFVGVGGTRFPVVAKSAADPSPFAEDLYREYGDFDRAVVEGRYLLDEGGPNSIRGLYGRLVAGTPVPAV